MFATVRRYEGIETSHKDELKKKVGESLAPRLSKLPGFSKAPDQDLYIVGDVINEVGISHGANIPVFLVKRRDRRALPSNIARLPVLDYAARGFRPQKAELARLARFVRWIWQDYTKSLTAQGVIQMEARDLTRVSRLTTVRERNYWKLRYKLATASPFPVRLRYESRERHRGRSAWPLRAIALRSPVCT